MRAALSLLMVSVCVLLVGVLQAADEKEKKVTLKGNIMCAKCALKLEKKCTNVIQVKENNKEVTYYFKDKGTDEEYHEEVCGGDKKEGTVTGTVSEKDGKKFITPTKVEYAKK